MILFFDILSQNFIRIELMSDTLSRFPIETPRCYAEPKSNAFTLRPYSTENVFTLGIFYDCFLKKMKFKKFKVYIRNR